MNRRLAGFFSVTWRPFQFNANSSDRRFLFMCANVARKQKKQTAFGIHLIYYFQPDQINKRLGIKTTQAHYVMCRAHTCSTLRYDIPELLIATITKAIGKLLCSTLNVFRFQTIQNRTTMRAHLGFLQT